jgi:hypothetical protein
VQQETPEWQLFAPSANSRLEHHLAVELSERCECENKALVLHLTCVLHCTSSVNVYVVHKPEIIANLFAVEGNPQTFLCADCASLLFGSVVALTKNHCKSELS